MDPRRGLFIFFIFFLIASGVAGWNLTVVHSGDTFGAVVAVNVANNPCAPTDTSYTSDLPLCLGGVARRAALIAQLRNASAHALVVDTGNSLPGANYFLFSPELVTNYTKGVGYDVVKLDLYDMQGGLSVLSSFLTAMEADGTTAVCSNLVGMQNESALANLTVQQYATIGYTDGQRVGFAGTMPANIAGLVSQPGRLDSTEEIMALQVAVGSLLNEGGTSTDWRGSLIVVAVSNLRLVEPLVQRVLGIDVVLVQGQYYANQNDTGTPIGPYPVVERLLWKQKVCIAGVGVWGKHVGKLDVVFDEFGVVESCSGDAVPLDDGITPVASIQAEVMQDYNRSMAGLNRVIGSAEVPLDYNHRCMFGECGLGSWTAEVLKKAGQTEIGIVNGGSFGGSIEAGNVTLAQFVRSFPFPADLIVTMDLKGKHLLEVLENSVSLANESSFDISQGIGRFLQVSGLRFTFNAKESVGMRIVNAWVQDSASAAAATTTTTIKRAATTWALVDPERDYSLTTISYISSGQDGYAVIPANAQNVQTTVRTAENVYREGLAAGPITGFATGLIVASTASRRTCIAPGSTTELCNGNGDCIAGSCLCTAPGATGEFCDFTSSSSGSDETLAIALGVILPLAFLAVVLAVLVAVLVLGYMRYRRPKLILKEPNYQLLVWRRDSLEAGAEVKMLPMRRLSVKVQTVLEEFLLDKHVVQAIGNVAHAKPSSSDEVAAAMMLVYQSSDKGTDLIRLLLKNELMALDDEKVLFREDTPGVQAFSVFSRMVGMPYLWNTFALPIAELELANNAHLGSNPSKSNVTDSDPAPLGSIFSLTTSVEINPKHLEEGQDNSVGRLQLELILQKLATRIFTSLPYFPLYLRQLCHMLYEDMRYDHPDYIHRVLGNLIFLRFICPALLVPQNYGLVKGEVHPKTHRTLILIAKVLQNLANKNDFSGKEEFMEVMNGFIERNVGKLEEFFNGLCAETDEPRFGDPPTSIVPRQFRKKALMVLYQFVRSHGKEIHDELSEFPPYAVQESLERLKYITRDINIRDFVSSDESESESEAEGTR